MASTVAPSEAPSVTLSCRFAEADWIRKEQRLLGFANWRIAVANNFWGKEDAGVTPLLDRMAGAKQTCDELRAFYNGNS
jgi:hypothetical protein